MSQAIAYADSSIQWISGNWNEYSEDILWTRIFNTSFTLYPTPTVDNSDEFHHFSKQAGLASIKFSETTHQLSLTPLVFENSTYASSITVDNVDLDVDDDIWVEMPPLFSRRVSAKARNGGQGQSLADLEPLDED